VNAEGDLKVENNFIKAKSLNKNLHKANQAKKDEFYTQLPDIENELKHYKEQFLDKVVYCNCDDPFESNFFKYFAANFNALKLKKLITTSYVKSPIVGGQLPLFEMEGLKPEGKQPFKIVISEVSDTNADGAVDLTDIEWLLRHDANTSLALKDNGDFRSNECIELLKQADIVVTNPPFSLFREYVVQLMEYGKKFLILGDQNAITYNEIFKFIKENRLWLGYDNGGTKWFQVPLDYDIPTESRKKIENGIKYFSMGRILWFTNLDTLKRNEKLILYKKYSPEEYPKFDNYDAININKTTEIPADYKGVIGVPITFIDKYNPEQFEILGITDRQNTSGLRTKKYTIEDSIRFNDLNARGVLKSGNDYQAIYARLLVKNKEVKN